MLRTFTELFVYMKAIELDEGCGWYHLTMGLILWKSGRRDGVVLKECLSAAQTDPYDAQAFFLLGQVLRPREAWSEPLRSLLGTSPCPETAVRTDFPCSKRRLLENSWLRNEAYGTVETDDGVNGREGQVPLGPIALWTVALFAGLGIWRCQRFADTLQSWSRWCECLAMLSRCLRCSRRPWVRCQGLRTCRQSSAQCRFCLFTFHPCNLLGSKRRRNILIL